MEFEGPGEEEELDGLEKSRGGCAFAVDTEDVFEEVGFLDVAAEEGEVVGLGAGEEAGASAGEGFWVV